MTACFSTVGMLSMPPIYVLSKIERLAQCLKKASMPNIQIKSLDIPDLYRKDTAVTKEFNDVLKDVEIVVSDTDLLLRTYSFMPSLKWAHTTWAGIEKLVEEIPEEPSFTVTRHSGERFTSSMAEYVVCNILNNERLFKLCWKNQQTKTWLPSHMFSQFRTLDQLTVGILGVGNMASAVAKFLKTRGATVYGLARIPRPAGSQPCFDEVFTKLEDILPKCDYLCNTLPKTYQTAGMLNNSVLEKCEKKPVFINIGRGSIISECELTQALKNNWLSGAILDVFEEEPLPSSSELWNMEQVTITPHIAALSLPEDIAEYFFENLMKYVDGHGLENFVNWSVGY